MKKVWYWVLFFSLLNQLFASIYQLHYDPRRRYISDNGIEYVGGPYYDYIPPGETMFHFYIMPHVEEEKNNYSLGMISADGTIMTSFMMSSYSPDFIRYVDIWRKNGPIDGSTPDAWTFRRERGELLAGYTSSGLGYMSDDGAYIVGNCHDPAYYDIVACYWDQNSNVHSLGTLLSGSFNTAQAVSNAGVIVGSEWNYDLNVQFAFIWTESQGLQNLQDILVNYGHNLDGWTLTEANWINPEGTIIEGYGIDPSGQMTTWTFTIPEPASLLFLTLSSFALRKRK